MTIRILVTGSRDWDNRVLISRQVFGYINKTCPMLLDEHGHPDRRDTSDVVIVHGDCPKGADALVESFARGCVPPIKTEPHPADWAKWKRRAGIVRNAQMVNLGADVCFAFINPCRADKCEHEELHGSHGATNCAYLADRMGIETHVVNTRKISA